MNEVRKKEVMELAKRMAALMGLRIRKMEVQQEPVTMLVWRLDWPRVGEINPYEPDFDAAVQGYCTASVGVPEFSLNQDDWAQSMEEHFIMAQMACQ
jgi:hypothetical protein